MFIYIYVYVYTYVFLQLCISIYIYVCADLKCRTLWLFLYSIRTFWIEKETLATPHTIGSFGAVLGVCGWNIRALLTQHRIFLPHIELRQQRSKKSSSDTTIWIFWTDNWYFFFVEYFNRSSRIWKLNLPQVCVCVHIYKKSIMWETGGSNTHSWSTPHVLNI